MMADQSSFSHALRTYMNASESDSESESDRGSDSSRPGPSNGSGEEGMPYIHKCLFFCMSNLKLAGINKHLNMMLLQENVKEKYNIVVPSKYIWRFLDTYWDKEKRDKIEGICFDNDSEEFDLPEEYTQLISDAQRKIQEKESLNTEKEENKLEDLCHDSDKTNSVSNLIITPVHSEDNLNEIIPFAQTSPAQTSEVLPEEIQSRRRSLRVFDKSKENELIGESSKTKKISLMSNTSDNYKELSDRSKYLENGENVSNSQKSEVCNVSESNISSDNIKQSKDNNTDKPNANIICKPVIPDVTLKETSKISVTPEINSRKSNLRSGSKGQQFEPPIKNLRIDLNDSVEDHIVPHSLNVKNVKHEKGKNNVPTPVTPLSKQSMQVENEENNKGVKPRRLTSDLLVCQQTTEMLPLTRRSCSKKT